MPDVMCSREPTEEERAKWAAEAEQARAEARRAVAEAEAAEHRAAIVSLERQQKEEEHRRKIAADDFYHRTYDFDSVVTPDSANACIRVLKQWDRLDPACRITINFNSPGGAVFAGMELFDYIQQLRRKGHYVTTVACGHAASMAGILLQAGDLRVMTREAYVLIHEISSMTHGKSSDIKDEVKFMETIQERIINIFVQRARETNRPKAITRRQLRARWHRKDWWLSSDEAYELGIVDEVW